MAPRNKADGAGHGQQQAPRISAGGTYSLDQVSIGAKLYVEKSNTDSGETEQRLAEVLSIREKKKSRLRAILDEESGLKEENEPKEPQLDFYVHYCDFNKRLDEWVPASKLVLSRDMEWPPPPEPPGGNQHKRKVLKGSRGGSRPPSSASPQPAANREASVDKDSSAAHPDDGAVVAMEMVGQGDVAEQNDAPGKEVAGASPQQADGTPEPFSKKKEVEKLRTGGSMTQCSSEIARVKNLNMLQMGKHEIEAWYFSPYPVEYAHIDCLYLCEMCLAYFPSEHLLKRHRRKCLLLHPPGNEIYRHEDISFFEIDGRRQKTWCRNLCLLSKCFLDHKTLYYDVDPFLYYVMVQRDNAGCHLIGYFSKEKESAEGYNVACILTLPQHQRSGFGRLLIEFSYELSKRENKLGSPEKPLSDLGLLGYRAYWAETIVELLLHTDEEISIDEIAHKTSIVHADVLQTCQALNMLKQYQGKHYLVLSDAVIEKHERQMKKKRRRIHSEALNWKPPVFTRDQLRFGW